MKKALVLGLARSGLAAQAALEARGTEVVAADRTLGNDTDLALLDGVDVLVKSPGVPGEAPLVVAARERGVPVWSEIELASRYLENPIVGVTGTNGKTTTTELLGAMLGAQTAGNVGTALSELVGEVEPDEWIVCELSSFQLEDVEELRPRIAVLLNLEPDHLDRHGTFERYRDAKLRIFENQTAEDVAVVPRGFGPVPGAGAPGRVLGRRRVARRAADPRRAQPRERCRRDGGRSSGWSRRRGDRGRADVLRGRPAPARARRRDRRRPLRQRLQGDEHRSCPARADGVRRAAPPDPRRLAQGRALRRVRAGRREGRRRHGLSDRRGGRAARRRSRLRERAVSHLGDARARGRGGGECGATG